MKPIPLFTITKNIGTYEALYFIDIKATMYYNFFFHYYEHDYVMFFHVGIDATYTSHNEKQATHHNLYFRRSYGHKL